MQRRLKRVRGNLLVQTIKRFIHPRTLTHLWLLALAGIIDFLGNEIAAQVRLRAGHRLQSPALIADGKHARVDGFVSLSVLASATIVGLGLPRADPIIGLIITLVILHITWESWQTIAPSRRLVAVGGIGACRPLPFDRREPCCASG
jgi:divalent metal cation (Fe/Co/Zn/Cd) transporter